MVLHQRITTHPEWCYYCNKLNNCVFVLFLYRTPFSRNASPFTNTPFHKPLYCVTSLEGSKKFASFMLKRPFVWETADLNQRENVC